MFHKQKFSSFFNFFSKLQKQTRRNLAKRTSHENLILSDSVYPGGNYMFKVNDRSTRTRREICSKLRVKAPEQRHWRRSSALIVNIEHIQHLVLVFLLLTLSR